MRRWEVTLIKSGKFDSKMVYACDETAARNYAKRNYVKRGWTISSVRMSNEFVSLEKKGKK